MVRHVALSGTFLMVFLCSCGTARQMHIPVGTRESKTIYRDNGTPNERVCLDKRGRKLLATAWYPNGMKKTEQRFDDQGNLKESKSWHDNGELRESAAFSNGKKVQALAFYRDGKPKVEAQYGEDGKLTSYTRWDENGQVVEKK